MRCEISEFADGSLCLELGDGEGGETDLVFASGCMRGDPELEKQRALLEELVRMWDWSSVPLKQEAG